MPAALAASSAASSAPPPTTTAPARRPTSSTATSSRRWQAQLPAFRFVPALSEGEWDGETGLITDVVERLEADFDDVDAYVCGPPPMVEAAQGLLMAKGVPESRIYFDKFTTTETEETSRT